MFEQKYEKKKKKKISENFQFLEVKFSIGLYLNMRVFVMKGNTDLQMILYVRKHTFGQVRPAKFEISLCIRAV